MANDPHAHGAEDFKLPHGSRWPIVAAFGIFLLYIGLVFGVHYGIGGWAFFGLGALVILVSAVGIVNEDGQWWHDRVSTGLRNGWWGVLFFLGTEVMLFAALFATFFNHRAAAGALWGLDPEGHFYLSNAVYTTGINTVVLLLSGVTMHMGHSAIRRGERQRMQMWLAATIVLGAVFLGGQVLEYLNLAKEGLIVQNGTFGATFFMLTGTHGAHVLGGLIAICFMLFRSFRGQFDQQRHVGVEVTAIYWHFVDVVWVVLYAVVYLRIL